MRNDISIDDIKAAPSHGIIQDDSFHVILTESELDRVITAVDVMGDRVADREGYSSGEEYWDLKEKLLSHENKRKNNCRLEALRGYKENEESLKRAAEKQQEDEISDLVSQIKALEPRIHDLIATGNACLQSNIPLTGQAYGMREAYDTNQFFTNSWSHLVGFAGNPSIKPCHIEFLGINCGGACGVYNFRTDGVTVFSVNERDPGDVIVPSVGHMKRFLSCFDDFETSFYAYVDMNIEKQQKSVDKLIASAQEKTTQQKASKQAIPVMEL